MPLKWDCCRHDRGNCGSGGGSADGGGGEGGVTLSADAHTCTVTAGEGRIPLPHLQSPRPPSLPSFNLSSLPSSLICLAFFFTFT